MHVLVLHNAYDVQAELFEACNYFCHATSTTHLATPASVHVHVMTMRVNKSMALSAGV